MVVDPDLFAFGRQVRQVRLSKGLSQEYLAELAGLHRNYVGLIERGERTASVKTVFQLARALKVAPAVLFDGVA